MHQNIIASVSYSTDNVFIIFGILSIIIFLNIFIPLSPAIIMAALLRKRVEKYLKHNTGTIIAHYDPPRDFSPAEVGFLYDSVCGEKEIRATLFHLMHRKIITITSSQSVEVIDDVAYKNLHEYEKIAIRLFDQQTARADRQFSTRNITILDEHGQSQTISFTTEIKQSAKLFTKAVQGALRDRGIPTKSYSRTFWTRVWLVFLSIYGVLWMLLFVALAGSPSTHSGMEKAGWSVESVIFSFVAISMLLVFFAPVLFFISWLTMKIFVKIAGRVWLNTKQVRKIWLELEGYRRFLASVDLPRIQFELKNTNTDKQVADTLPYAMVLNLEAKWQDMFR